ncbi:hypothetical protein PW52_01675 [Tamlana sedimentorum]|uniref:Dienelactone hydrolase domain-containing protein n=1 Tax=Neotamlana sedimentorum TaxID=1435349 RepID=A0A0D7WDL3_9FLAO|nr:dienelactone hydrolase family protein [Tamlana sedimentorum]KJD37189.1 hypothetical protein PW52_01675 [Tamlana sedimentorum]
MSKVNTINVLIITILFGFVSSAQSILEETFPPLTNIEAPQSYDELWKSFNPRAEPLDTEILHEWEEDNIVMQVLRYRVGVFKGHKAMMAAVYGYPKGAENLSGLVQIHGGGQYANYKAVLQNAKRGYATISISWAGRIEAPNYKVNPEVVQLFWDNKTDDPNYKITTDWGLLDAYQAPHRNEGNSSAYVKPQHWTLDSVESPRNNLWFLCTVGARRALTFLEKQPQVNPEKLGVYGHSMGGKITVLTSTDSRVKAAAPSCGGISNNDNENALYQNTIADNLYLKEIRCPIIFLSPSNDFHGHLQDIPKAVDLIKTEQWRVTSSPHHNHQDTPEFEVATLLWFDQYLKNEFQWPSTPQTKLELGTKSKTPSFTVVPDELKPIISIDVYYLQPDNEGVDITREERVNRFWHHAVAEKNGDVWKANLPVHTTNKGLWVFANVLYALDEEVSGTGYYYRTYTTDKFNVSSMITMVSSQQLQDAKVKSKIKHSRTIETFQGDWEKDWFSYLSDNWARKTHKLNDELWKAPKNAKLVFEVRSKEPNKMVVGIDNYGSEIQLKGELKWQHIVLSEENFKNALGEKLASWNTIKEFRLGDKEILKQKETRLKIGAEWEGDAPEFRNLHWEKNKS